MVWLIGNKGMLGREVEELFQKKSVPYIATDMDVDILKAEELKAFSTGKNINWIVNCSAYTAVDLAEDEKEKAFAVNGQGIENIANIASELNAKMIHISTDYVYSGEKKGIYLENDPVRPIGVYGASKLDGEKKLSEILKEKFIIRISWLFGKHGGNFVSTMLGLFKEREELSVVADQKGSPTYTADLATLILKIISNNSEDYGVYHYSNEGFTTWHEFALAIMEKAKKVWPNKLKTKHIKPISTEEYPAKAKRPINSCMSKEKIKKAFKIKIPTWEDALERYLKELS